MDSYQNDSDVIFANIFILYHACFLKANYEGLWNQLLCKTYTCEMVKTLYEMSKRSQEPIIMQVHCRYKKDLGQWEDV